LLSIVMERLLFVHLYNAPELDQVLMTIGFNFVVVAALTLFFGTDVYPVRLPPWLAGSVDLGFRTFEVYRVITMAVCLAVIGLLWLAFDRTNLCGRKRPGGIRGRHRRTHATARTDLPVQVPGLGSGGGRLVGLRQRACRGRR